jgi:hypothetical protein
MATPSLESFVTSSPAVEILRTSARALAARDPLAPTLDAILRVVAEELTIASAAVFVVDAAGALAIAASIGLDDPARLTAAVRDPAHPVARTMADRAPSFDVTPMAAGGPPLRGHLPLAIGRDGTTVTRGVLALAYERPMEPESRSILEAVGDLIAVAIDREGARV